jgi:hypothetical protein
MDNLNFKEEVIFEAYMSILNSDGFIQVSKQLSKRIGLIESVIYAELLSRYKYFKDKGSLDSEGYFYNTVGDLGEATTIKDGKTQTKYVKRLEQIGLIKTKLKGLPAKRHFKIVQSAELLTILLTDKTSETNETSGVDKIRKKSISSNAKNSSKKTKTSKNVDMSDVDKIRKKSLTGYVNNTEVEMDKIPINNTNTNNTNLNNICSSSNEVDIYKEFELNICELRKTTRLKFDEFINKHDSDFILSILEQCSISNIKSYAGFEKVYNSYIERNCTTRSDVEQATNDYRINNTKKNKKEHGESKKANKNGFNNFEHREIYDSEEQMTDLERKLLGWDK